MDQIVEVSQFEIDTIEGLSKNQKTLKSKYFYDANRRISFNPFAEKE